MHKKSILFIAAFVIAATAHAHRPRIIDCAVYSSVAARAAADRDAGATLGASLDHLKSERRYDVYLDSYIELTRDVYTQDDLKSATPNIISKAAGKACVASNSEERRTRELY